MPVPRQESERSCICVLGVCVLGYRFCLFLRYFHWILQLFRQCFIFCFPFYCIWRNISNNHTVEERNFILVNKMKYISIHTAGLPMLSFRTSCIPFLSWYETEASSDLSSSKNSAIYSLPPLHNSLPKLNYRVRYLSISGRVRIMLFNAIFNDISVISWRSVYCWRKPEYPEKTIDLSQITEKLYHIMFNKMYFNKWK